MKQIAVKWCITGLRSALLAGVLLSLPLSASESEGVVHIESRHSVEDTVERARRMVERQGLRVFGVIDHRDAAQKTGAALAPTRVLVFGNPKRGTQLMRENRIIGLDLPMKLLVWEDADGVVWISYPRAEELAARHGFGATDKRFARIGQVLKDLAKTAAR